MDGRCCRGWSVESKRSIRLGPVVFTSSFGAVCGAVCDAVGAGFDFCGAETARLLPAPLSFSSPAVPNFCARYSRRRWSKSGSLRSSSRSLARSVDACFRFGIARRVAFSNCRAIRKNFTTSSVCTLNRLYIFKARSVSGRDISK